VRLEGLDLPAFSLVSSTNIEVSVTLSGVAECVVLNVLYFL
jgi:hypothetical protein